MKAKINHTKLNRNTKLCALMGYFDENGQYCETYVDEVALADLPKDAIGEVGAGHDITIQILPKRDIVVFAKNPRDMDKYQDLMGANYIKEMLDAFSKYNKPEDGRFWATYDFSTSI